jgi:hypothetical protein
MFSAQHDKDDANKFVSCGQDSFLIRQPVLPLFLEVCLKQIIIDNDLRRHEPYYPSHTTKPDAVRHGEGLARVSRSHA